MHAFRLSPAFRSAAWRRASVLAATMIAWPALAAAQTPARAAARPASSSWEIEGYGGLSVTRIPAAGSAALPPPGAPIVTSSPLDPSRAVPSWTFGDGATILNAANEQLGVSSRLVPLDGAFGPLRGATGGAFGLRVRRRLTRHLSAEVSLDALLGTAGDVNALASAMETTRASFVSAFQGLLATGPFTNVAVDATTSRQSGAARDLFFTAAGRWEFAAHGRFVPYVTAGAGVTTGAGTLPSIALTGHYKFQIVGVDGQLVPIDETDRVTLRYVRRTTAVGVFGGGVRRDLSRQWGVSADVRVFVGPNNTQLLLDATPTVARGSPAGFIESFTDPAVQFSNDPSTGRQSTLSGPALSGFTAFQGTGIATRVIVTIRGRQTILIPGTTSCGHAPYGSFR